MGFLPMDGDRLIGNWAGGAAWRASSGFGAASCHHIRSAGYVAGASSFRTDAATDSDTTAHAAANTHAHPEADANSDAAEQSASEADALSDAVERAQLEEHVRRREEGRGPTAGRARVPASG